MSEINISAKDMVVRQDHQRHVCLEYYRGGKWSEYIAFDPAGAQKIKALTHIVARQFDKVLELPLDRAVLAFLRCLKREYAPGNGVPEILMEIYKMSKAPEVGDFSKLDLKGLTACYNELAIIAKKSEVKSFKSKGEAIKRIEAVQAIIIALTPEQTANKGVAAEKAAKRLSGLTELKALKEKAVKPVKEKAVKSKKQGIGAFCIGLIQKGKTNDEVLAAVKSQFPDASTSPASIAWYRNKVKA